MPRSKLDFLAQVLETARNGKTKEQIVSQANASHGLVDSSLGLLKDLNLLTETRSSPVLIVITQKGRQFLHDYERLTQQLGSDDVLK